MIRLLLEGFHAAWLPSSLLVVVPGLAALLAAQDELRVTLVGFCTAVAFVSWLRFSHHGADWPLVAAAVALVLATLLFLVPTVDGRKIVSSVGGALAGGAAAELWQPLVGPELGRLLVDLPNRGWTAPVSLAVYLLGVLTPVIILGLLLRLAPNWLLESASQVLAYLGGAVLAALAILTAIGLHDWLASHLIQWSTA